MPEEIAGAGERRREPRYALNGPVEMRVDEPVTRFFRGELVDWSQSGFRVSHHNTELHTGQSIRFRHPRGSGLAKVMWTRILAGQIESGFLVLPADPFRPSGTAD